MWLGRHENRSNPCHYINCNKKKTSALLMNDKQRLVAHEMVEYAFFLAFGLLEQPVSQMTNTKRNIWNNAVKF